MSVPSYDQLPWRVSHHWVSSPLQSCLSAAGRNFPCWLLKRSCLRLSAQATKVKGEGHPGSQEWRDPQATLDLLAAFLAAHSQLLIWVCGSEMRARAAKGPANSSLIETAWFEGPLFILSQRISVCAFLKARKVLATSSFTNTSAGFEERYNNSMKVLGKAHIPTGLNASSVCLAANWPIQSTDAIIFSY